MGFSKVTYYNARLQALCMKILLYVEM